MSEKEKHGFLDDMANYLDPLHLCDFVYGNDDGYTTYREMVISEMSECNDDERNTPYNLDEYDDDLDEYDDDLDEYDDDLDEYDDDLDEYDDDLDEYDDDLDEYDDFD